MLRVFSRIDAPQKCRGGVLHLSPPALTLIGPPRVFVLVFIFFGLFVRKAKLADSQRQLEGSKAIEDALQSELNTTLAAYAQSKEGNQKLIQVGCSPTVEPFRSIPLIS